MQKIKEIENLNTNQLDLTDIHRTLHYTFFSSAHGTLSRIGHMIGHKNNLQ